jgi:transketolase C-terminal domain/subunit
LACADALRQQRHANARVLSMPSIKPLDEEAVRCAGCETRGIVVLEEHRVIGGLGTAVADVLAGMEHHAPLRVYGIPDRYDHLVGDQSFLINQLGDVTALACALLDKQQTSRTAIVPFDGTSSWSFPTTPSE